MQSDPSTAEPAPETIRVGEHSHVLARASRADDRTRVLKHGDTFAVFDRYADIFADRLGDQGLYHAGTRHVSRLDLLINQLRPLLLSSSLDRENLLLLVDLTNPDLSEGDEIVVPRGSLHILRTSVVWEGVLHQRLDIQNFGLRPVRVGLALRLLADFSDVFEVRGVVRTLPGKPLGASAHERGIEILYVGSDKVARATTLSCDPPPTRCTPGGVEFRRGTGRGRLADD
jgi:glycogen debranching enzyme